MTSQTSELADFGWNSFFASQLDPDDLTPCIPVRVMAVHRDRIRVAGPAVDTLITPFTGSAGDEEFERHGGRLAAASIPRRRGRAACCGAPACSSAVPREPAASCS